MIKEGIFLAMNGAAIFLEIWNVTTTHNAWAIFIPAVLLTLVSMVFVIATMK